MIVREGNHNKDTTKQRQEELDPCNQTRNIVKHRHKEIEINKEWKQKRAISYTCTTFMHFTLCMHSFCITGIKRKTYPRHDYNIDKYKPRLQLHQPIPVYHLLHSWYTGSNYVKDSTLWSRIRSDIFYRSRCAEEIYLRGSTTNPNIRINCWRIAKQNASFCSWTRSSSDSDRLDTTVFPDQFHPINVLYPACWSTVEEKAIGLVNLLLSPRSTETKCGTGANS